ncbi:unnamed protein product [Didymodactylos carnosus]|uniref:Uncharacterized protein n=1 Tax=Didymodactylos carnosus TaxID=1234261 RepID=A0A815RWX8_9BILA|nr:unnamed protein product [Didymodactylos carnosus]CAF4347154.1 unnamed protein product [Didymodactylos carnosus]
MASINNKLRRQRYYESVLISSVNRTEQSHTNLDSSFIYFQLLIDILLKSNCVYSLHDFIHICKYEYYNDLVEQRRIDEFHQTYTQETSIEWYTKDCFVYRLLNRVLRQQNTDLLIKFQFLIKDIYEQLEQFHQQQKRDWDHHQYVYRGQLMSTDELNHMKSNIGELISMNSFLSTTLDRELAREFICCTENNHNYQTVLFEIEIDRSSKRKPYANITQQSHFDSEEEILFMIGSIFRIVAINHEPELNTWIVQLVFCDDNELELKPMYDYMKMEFVNNKYALGKLLWQRCEFDQAEYYYRQQLLLHENDSECYHGLGLIYRTKGHLDSALVYHHQALELQLPSDHKKLAYSYGYIGEIHIRKDENQLALKYFKLALYMFTNDQPNSAWCCHNLGILYRKQKQYDLALKYFHRTLEKHQKYLPKGHPHEAATINQIGIIYRCQGQYLQALEQHEKALEMRLKYLPAQHPYISQSFQTIGLLYQDKGDNEQALYYYDQAENIIKKGSPSNHRKLTTIQQQIKSIKITTTADFLYTDKKFLCKS